MFICKLKRTSWIIAIDPCSIFLGDLFIATNQNPCAQRTPYSGYNLPQVGEWLREIYLETTDSNDEGQQTRLLD